MWGASQRTVYVRRVHAKWQVQTSDTLNSQKLSLFSISCGNLHQTEKYFKAVESVSSCSTHYSEKREDLLVILNLLQLQTQSSFPFSQFTSLHQPEEDSIVWQHIHRRSVQLIRGEDKQDQRVKYGLFLHHMITCKKIIWQLVKYSLDSIVFLFSGQGVIFPPVSGRDGCPAVPSVQSSKLPHVSFQLNNST